MAEPRVCSGCLQPVPGDAPRGLCPACLSRAAQGTNPDLTHGESKTDNRNGPRPRDPILAKALGETGGNALPATRDEWRSSLKYYLHHQLVGEDATARHVLCPRGVVAPEPHLAKHGKLPPVQSSGAGHAEPPLLVLALHHSPR